MNSDERPNIIVFFTDQQRWDTTGAHGNPLELTPNFDRMARMGTHLYHSFTCQPVCGPARASFQTGMYGTATGCHSNGIPLAQNSKTIAHFFREAGYRTGYIGKWHLASQEPVPENERGGYEYWLGANILETCSEPYGAILFDQGNERVRLPGYRTDALTDAAIRFVDEHQHTPFFLFLSHIEPHQQNNLDNYPAPEGYEERYTSRWIPPDLAAGMQGRSILPLIRKEEVEWPQEVFVQITGKRLARAIRTQRWKYSIKAPNQESELNGGSNVYVEDCLYDLQADPHELTNIIGCVSFQDETEVLREKLIRRMQEAGEEIPVILPAEPVMKKGRLV
jgi:arylsulfatase A-like enzyme